MLWQVNHSNKLCISCVSNNARPVRTKSIRSRWQVQSATIAHIHSKMYATISSNSRNTASPYACTCHEYRSAILVCCKVYVAASRLQIKQVIWLPQLQSLTIKVRLPIIAMLERYRIALMSHLKAEKQHSTKQEEQKHSTRLKQSQQKHGNAYKHPQKVTIFRTEAGLHRSLIVLTRSLSNWQIQA